MTMSDQIRKTILEAAKAAGYDMALEDMVLEHPTVEDHGDYSTNIALKLKQGDPMAVAEKIATEIKTGDVFQEVRAVKPGFINFWLAKDVLVGEVGKIARLGEKYGENETGAGKTMIIDYSAPNIAKRFGIGHLRSTIIGQAIYNLYKLSGFKTIGDNHLGDWGTQFGKLLYMIDFKKATDFTLDDLEKWYVEFHEKAEKDPALDERGREWFKKLEEGDTTARGLWKKCVDISMGEFNRIYDLLGVKIDFAYGESFYKNLMGEVISEAKNKKIATESQGAWVIEIPGQKTPLLLVKSDGTTTYATRDLATLKFRQKEWNPDVVIYEVGAEQALHFVQLFAAARTLGYVKPDMMLVHTKHGLYRYEHGKMKTRKGDTIKLEEILTEAISRAKKLAKDATDEKTARAVGIGAVKYFDLRHNVQSDIVFDWEKMFALDGDSGPYLQYTYARARSVIRKSEMGNGKLDREMRSEKKSIDQKIPLQNPASNFSHLTSEELGVLRYLYRFPEVVELAARTYSPNLVCNYLFELAQRYNAFYNNCPIIGNEVRVNLTAATAQVIKNGLTLLGIEALEKM